MEMRHNESPGHQMSELHHSLEAMGVLQFLFAVAFLICYALAIGGFFGPGARAGLFLVGFTSAIGFSAFTDKWVHGVILTAFAVIGVGLFIGVAWLLKLLFASAVGDVSIEAAYDDAFSASLSEAVPEPEAPATRLAPEPTAEGPIGRLLGGDGPTLDQHAS